MIWFFTPYSLDKNIGQAYNHYCENVPDGDWICLMDGDAMFLVPNFGHIMQHYIDCYPSGVLFVPVTNRVGKKSQCYKGMQSEETDIIRHREIALSLSQDLSVKSMNHVKYPSMPCFLFNKEMWKKVGGFKNTDILGVDTDFSRKVMKYGDCYRMEGLYMLHYYRLNEGIGYKQHLL